MAMATKSPRKAPKNWSPKTKARHSRRGGASRRPAKGTSISHSCGHSQRHPLPFIKWKREREQARLTKIVCTACWQHGKVEEVEALCDGIDLPELTGTEPQVLWTRSIRALAVFRVRSKALAMDRERVGVGLAPAADRFMALALPHIRRKVLAKWWIDHRDEADALELVAPAKALQELADLQAEAAAVPECPF